MRLTRIRIENLRHYRALDIEGLQPGVNLFVGPNGTGKSTLVAAIRAAFLERYRSSSVTDLLPPGDTGAAPTVNLDFEWNGTRYALTKTFLKRPRCTLTVGSRVLDADEAEGHLAEMFGYEYSGKGESKDRHAGIPGLLWVQQGTGQNVHDAVGHAKDRLQGALHATLTEVTSTEGDTLIMKVSTERNLLLTSTGKPRGAYLEAIQHLQTVEAQRAELEGKVRTYGEYVERLDQLQRERARLDAARPWLESEVQAKRAREELERIAVVQGQLEQITGEIEQARRRLEIATARLKDFEAEARSLRDREGDLTRATEVVANAQSELSAWDEPLRLARERARDAADLARRARLARERALHSRARDTAASALAPLERTLENARAAQADLASCREAAAPLAAVARALPSLDRQAAEIDTLRARVEGAASRVRFDLEPGATVRAGVDVLAGSGELFVTEPLAIAADGVGRFVVQPGGADLATHRAALDAAIQQLDTDLRAVGAESLEHARERAAVFETWKRRGEQAQALLQSIAPDGLDALEASLTDRRGELAVAEDALQALPIDDDGQETLPSHEAAQAETEAAQSALADTQRGRDAAQSAVREAASRLDTARMERDRLAERLQSPARQQERQAAESMLVEANATIAERSREQEALEAKVREAQPALLAQDVRRFEASAREEHEAFLQCDRALGEARGWVQSQGVHGLEEQLEAARSDHEQAERRHAELARRARALDHLHELLLRERQVLTRRLQAPLQARFDHYVRLLFAQGGLEVREDLSPGALRGDARAVQPYEFAALSFGTREQLGVVSRLGYADLLQAAGRPTLLIFDDVLVHADDDRLAAMKRVLFDAAERHQILLLSCHPERWRGLGVAPRDLAALSA